MTDCGTVTLRLYRDANTAVIDVSDTGVGIPEADRKRIFDPFFTTKETGTGLGLSICHKIIQDHSGSISVSSSPSRGTSFTIRFPLTDQISDKTGSCL
jgi:signal transduction histidine kinase